MFVELNETPELYKCLPLFRERIRSHDGLGLGQTDTGLNESR